MISPQVCNINIQEGYDVSTGLLVESSLLVLPFWVKVESVMAFSLKVVFCYGLLVESGILLWPFYWNWPSVMAFSLKVALCDGLLVYPTQYSYLVAATEVEGMYPTGNHSCLTEIFIVTGTFTVTESNLSYINLYPVRVLQESSLCLYPVSMTSVWKYFLGPVQIWRCTSC